MTLGARSIRGSMGTYAWVSLGLTALLALVLWVGPCGGPVPARVALEPGGPWLGATLDDGTRSWELSPDKPLWLPPGDYRVTLFDLDGGHLVTTLQLGDEPVQLGADLNAADALAR